MYTIENHLLHLNPGAGVNRDAAQGKIGTVFVPIYPCSCCQFFEHGAQRESFEHGAQRESIELVFNENLLSTELNENPLSTALNGFSLGTVLNENHAVNHKHSSMYFELLIFLVICSL